MGNEECELFNTLQFLAILAGQPRASDSMVFERLKLYC